MELTFTKKLGFLLTIASLLVFSFRSQSQTTLAAGDVVIIGWNSNDNTVNNPSSDDDIDFLLLKNITAGTDIYFTDLGWTGSGFQSNTNGSCTSPAGAANDGCLKWTSSTAMTAGTQVHIGCHFLSNASAGTLTGILQAPSGGTNAYMSLATTTDQIFAFQGSLASPTLIAAVNYGTTGWTATTQCQFISTTSTDPGSNVGGYGFVYTSASINENGKYTGATTAGDAATLRTAILNSANWSFTDGAGSVYTFPTGTSFSVGKSWAGTTTNWNTAGNWNPSGVPSGTDDVIIPSGQSAYPNISSGTATVNSITINSGGSTSVTVSGTGVLQIAGSITNNGTFSASSGGITLNGSSAQTLSGSAFTGSTIEDLVINNSAGVSITSALNIAATGSLTVSSGTLTTGGNLTLLSTSSGTARVANSSGTISGNVTVQRYIPGGRRAYRFLAHPLTTTQPLSILTDDIDITGTGGSTNGFTTTVTNHSSSFWYDVTTANGSTVSDPGWTAFTSTNGAGANGWDRYEGLLVMVRGAIGEGLNGAAYTPSAVTLDMTGTINQGSQVVNVTKGTNTTYAFVGNPFPSQIDMSLVTTGGGIGSSFYVWNPNLATKGAYASFSWGNSLKLPSCGAFITSVSSTTTLTFPESCKSSSTPSSLFKTTSVNDNLLLSLYSNNDSIHWDQLQVTFDNSYVNDYDWADASKFVNPEVNFYTYSNDNKQLSIDVRPYKDGEIIPLGLTSAPEGTYSLKTEEFNMSAGTNIYLHDKYLNKVQQLSPGYAYSFDVTSDPLSQGNRFVLELSGNPTSVKNIPTASLKAEISPNPASNVVTINYSSPVAAKAQVRVINLQGAVCRSVSKNIEKTGSMDVLINDLPAGAYIVEFTCGGQTVQQKLIKE